MNEQYVAVPNIISCKDLDYLSDMFNWNYGAYKNALNGSKQTTDEELKKILENCANTFHKNMTNILSIINEGGNNE